MKKRFKSLAILLLAVMSLLTACFQKSEPTATDSDLIVRFVDVGQADCALLSCDGENMLIDGGNAADSSLVYSYLKECGVTYLNYIIATHPHEDHIGGIPGALSYADAGIVYSPVAQSDNSYFKKLLAKMAEKGLTITVPEVGDSFKLGGAKVTILSPSEIVSDENENSIVCKVKLGDVSFLFTGDAGKQAENTMLENGIDVSATVLKVGHHGSDSATSYRFLREVNPVYAVISTEQDSQYGHPHENLLSRLNDAETIICRTDINGTIVFKTDGAALTVEPEKGSIGTASAKAEAADESTEVTETAEADDKAADALYIGNSSSKKYHLPTCRSLPSEKNTVYFYSLEEAIGSGYSPCGTCKPDAVK